jgi:hypothetical protein
MGSFYEKLKRLFDQLPKRQMIILLWDFNEKVGMEDILKQRNDNENLLKLVMAVH